MSTTRAVFPSARVNAAAERAFWRGGDAGDFSGDGDLPAGQRTARLSEMQPAAPSPVPARAVILSVQGCKRPQLFPRWLAGLGVGWICTLIASLMLAMAIAWTVMLHQVVLRGLPHAAASAPTVTLGHPR